MCPMSVKRLTFIKPQKFIGIKSSTLGVYVVSFNRFILENNNNEVSVNSYLSYVGWFIEDVLGGRDAVRASQGISYKTK